MKNSCISLIAKEKRQVSLCDQIVSSFDEFIEQVPELQGYGNFEKDICIYGIAIEEGSAKRCQQMENEESEAVCIMSVAAITGKTSLCNDIDLTNIPNIPDIQNQQTRIVDICLASIALYQVDGSVCVKITDPEIKLECNDLFKEPDPNDFNDFGTDPQYIHFYRLYFDLFFGLIDDSTCKGMPNTPIEELKNESGIDIGVKDICNMVVSYADRDLSGCTKVKSKDMEILCSSSISVLNTLDATYCFLNDPDIPDLQEACAEAATEIFKGEQLFEVYNTGIFFGIYFLYAGLFSFATEAGVGGDAELIPPIDGGFGPLSQVDEDFLGISHEEAFDTKIPFLPKVDELPLFNRRNLERLGNR